MYATVHTIHFYRKDHLGSHLISHRFRNVQPFFVMILDPTKLNVGMVYTKLTSYDIFISYEGSVATLVLQVPDWYLMLHVMVYRHNIFQDATSERRQGGLFTRHTDHLKGECNRV